MLHTCNNHERHQVERQMDDMAKTVARDHAAAVNHDRPGDAAASWGRPGRLLNPPWLRHFQPGRRRPSGVLVAAAVRLARCP